MKTFQKQLSLFLAAVMCFGLFTAPVYAEEAPAIDVKAKSAVLMSADTGAVLYEKNPHERLHPASVTKVMSLLLFMEAIEGGKMKLTDMVTPSDDAVKKGGSQIWLKQGESMSVNDLLKAVSIASANDACCALAEKVAGSEQAFVKLMNARAKELGMEHTNFENCSGLDDTASNHLTCAYDIALMSKELLKHELITKYSTTWMDTLRDGKTELTNTNKLVRFYQGTTGLKTGTTSKAGSCLSASARREGMHLIAVVMGCATSNDRFDSAKSMLNYGFANYKILQPKADAKQIPPIPVVCGIEETVAVETPTLASYLMEKGKESAIKQTVELPESLEAPVKKGQPLGMLTLTLDGKTMSRVELKAAKDVGRRTFWWTLCRLFESITQ